MGLHVYAHCLRGTPGGVALLVINNDKAASRTLSLPASSERYTLTANTLEDKQVRLNGVELTLGGNDDLPALTSAAAASGNITFAPTTITFLSLPGAGNSACR